MIIACGCSFTKYKWECWPKYLNWFEKSNKILNLGMTGSGNETISRAVNNAVLKYKFKKIYIMWSGVNRYEVIDNQKNTITIPENTYSKYDPDFEWNIWYGGHNNDEHHKFYQKYFLNEKHNYFRTLERILYTQLLLQKHNIEYVMMVMNLFVINHSNHSKAESALYNQIDWTKFRFYKNKMGLEEFAKELYPEHFVNGDGHPAPYTHYEWTRQIIFESNLECPWEEKQKLINRTKELNKIKL